MYVYLFSVYQYQGSDYVKGKRRSGNDRVSRECHLRERVVFTCRKTQRNGVTEHRLRDYDWWVGGRLKNSEGVNDPSYDYAVN